MNKLVEIILEDCERLNSQIVWSSLVGRRILLTGASGLLGSYFLASLYLLSQHAGIKFELYAVMNSPPPEYLKFFLNSKSVRVFSGDLTNIDFCRTLPEVDLIIHGAGYGQPGRFMENQPKTLFINTATTFFLFDKLADDGRFLFLSTSEVYSGLKTAAHSESEIGMTNTTHPRACYIEAKRCGEAICMAQKERGIKARSARLALAYGPGTRPGDKRVINTFIDRGLKGEVYLMDRGLARRTYCYVSDAVEIMWHILLYGTELIYNVGGQSKTTIADMALKIGQYLGSPVRFPNDSNEITSAPQDVSLDISRVNLEFNKKDYVSFEVGLARTIEWQRALYSGTVVAKT